MGPPAQVSQGAQGSQLWPSPDGQWVAHRHGRDVTLLPATGGAAVIRIELPTEDTDVAFVGPPGAMIAVVREAGAHRVVLHQPPYLDAVARLDLEGPMRLVAVTGARAILVTADATRVLIVRAAGRALAAQPLEPGGPVESAAGLDRNQVLLALAKKVEVWDAVSSRPLLRMQLQLPPMPRTVGPAQGHVWATRPGGDEIYVYRLSDGRPFRHIIGAPVRAVACNGASPVLVVATPRGLVRLHCFAHSMTVVDAPWTPPAQGAEAEPLAQVVSGEEVALVGLDQAGELWRAPLAGGSHTEPTTGAATAAVEATGPAPTAPPPAEEPGLATVASKLRAMRGQLGGAAASSEPVAAASPAPIYTPTVAAPVSGTARQRAWREPLALYGAELARGVESELPLVAVDTELGELAHRLALPGLARRALATLYALHLVGESALPLARLARVLGDWSEALGQGELVAHALVRRKRGTIALRGAVTDVLDGAAPRAIRLAGAAGDPPRPGAYQVARADRSDGDLEAGLAAHLGRIGVIGRAPDRAILEARLHGATAVALVAPPQPPAPWPRDAALIVVTDEHSPRWAAALPPS